MTTPNLNFIGIITVDLEGSVKFYRGLGLKIPELSEGQAHVQIQLPSGMTLAWDSVDVIKSMGGWIPPTGSPRMGLAFECESAQAVDRVFTDMTNEGHKGHAAPFEAPWGQRYATLLDPDGNGVDLYAWLPGEGPRR